MGPSEITRWGLSGARGFSVGDVRVTVEHRHERRADLGSPADEAVRLLTEALHAKAGEYGSIVESIALATAAKVKAEEERDAAREEARALKIANPPRPTRLLDRGYVRFTSGGEMWLLSKRETGWGAFGIIVDNWDSLFRRYNVRVVEHGEDESGQWWAVENIPAREAR